MTSCSIIHKGAALDLLVSMNEQCILTRLDMAWGSELIQLINKGKAENVFIFIQSEAPHSTFIYSKRVKKANVFST